MNRLTTATELAAALRAHELSAVEAVDSYLQRIETYNPRLNAVVTLDAEGARRQAREADGTLAQGRPVGALHGIPITIKDSFETGGMRTTAGYPPFSRRVPAEDALLVARLRSAGAIIMGKTNLPALASGIQSNNTLFGRTNNPWDVTRTPGGSSGGAAAAVAAGLTALDLGSDIGGSIRIPAHFCGIYGLKMTGQARLSKGHLASPKPLHPSEQLRALLDMAAYGPLARSVADLRLAFSVLADWSSASGQPTARLRIACCDDFGGAPLTRDTRAALESMVKRLKQAGHTVEYAAPPFLDFDDAWELGGECLGVVNSAFQPRLALWLRRAMSLLASTRKGQHPLMRGLYRGVLASTTQIETILRRRDALCAQIDQLLDTHDVWICPVFPTPAFTHRAPNAPVEVDGQPLPVLLANLLHPLIFNLSGHPAVVIPLGTEPLPIGVQIIGRRFGEAHLLDAAERIDRVIQGYCQPPLTR